MSGPPDISAIILSAGYSSRMGDFKPLLRFGEQTALERLVHIFECAGTVDVRVVLGHRAGDLIPVLKKTGARWTVNEQFDQGMFSSVMTGVRDLHSETKAFFVHPVDLPLIRFSTVQGLMEAFAGSSADVAYPSFLGKRGHPPLISTRLLQRLYAWNGSGGLRSFLHEVESQAVDIEVADRFIRRDMDTWIDYRSLCECFADYQIPSPDECMVMLVEKCSVSKSVLAHSLKVAEVASKLAGLLRAQGHPLNEKLLIAAALLHDLAKGLPDHGAAAARLLRRLGFEPVAGLVEGHMDCKVQEDRPVDEHDILRISDRIVEENRVVSLEQKFRMKLDRYAGNARATEAIQRKFVNSIRLRAKVENRIGQHLESALSAERGPTHVIQADDLFAQAWSNRPSV